jgi:hypothetical protein
MNSSKLLIISCFFGNSFTRVYHAPLETNCYFFSNNADLKNETESKGWNFIKVNFHQDTEILVSSLQAKYIKFLHFLNDYPEFKEYDQILYFDHKLYIKKEHIDTLKQISDDCNCNIIIRKHEAKRIGIFAEIDESMLQERYKKNMDKTIDFVNNKLQNKEIEENVEICNTGLIYYKNYNEVMPLLNDVYNTCISLQQPQCQIIWAVLSQKYMDKIKTISFYDVVNPVWTEPFIVNDKKFTGIFFYLSIGILFLLFFTYVFMYFSSLKSFSKFLSFKLSKLIPVKI